MDGQTKRRSSILKSAVNQELGEMSATMANLVKRRVSFHNMRTVQEFDQERNDITKTPLKEPIKLGDTGSSDGLHSTRASTFISSTCQTSCASNDKFEDTGGFDKTAGNFIPTSSSTPMPRACIKDCSSRLNTILLFGADSSFGSDDEHAIYEKMHNDTFIKDNVNMSHSISTLDGQKYADSNATNALFETTKEDCAENVPPNVSADLHHESEFSMKDMSFGTEDEVTRQLFGLSMEAISDAEEQVKADFLKSNIPEDADMTDKLFNVPMAVGNKVQIEDEKANNETTFVAANDEVLVGEEVEAVSSLTTSIPNTQREQSDSPHRIDAVTDESFHGNITSKLRFMDSPLAVAKKKSRLDGPHNDITIPFPNNESLDVPHISQIQITQSPLRLLDDFSNLASAEQTNLSPELLAIAKTKRYIRRSLDQSVNRSVMFSSPMIMLQDIMRPKNSLSLLSDEQDSVLLTSVADQSPVHFQSVLRSFTNETAPERTYISSQEDTIREQGTKFNDSCALTCRFDSIDFDIRIADVPCFQSKPDDHVIISRIREVARRNICKEMSTFIAESESEVENNLKDLVRINKRIAHAIKMLNPKRLTRSEARAFEVCRFKAQKTWYELRKNVAKITVDKTAELIDQKSSLYEKKLENLKTVEKYKSISIHERNGVEAAFLRLKDIEKLAVTGFEKNKFEIASLRKALQEKKLENVQLKKEIATLETTKICEDVESLRIKKESADQMMADINHKCSEAKQFYLASIKTLTCH